MPPSPRDLELRAHYQAHMEEGGRVKPMRGSVKMAGNDTDWRTASEDLLFVRKRAELLAQLLFAKQVFRAADLKGDPSAALDQLLAARTGQRAIDIVLTEFRKGRPVQPRRRCKHLRLPWRHTTNSQCGKLVALLLGLEGGARHYSARYGSQVSVIASQMAGRAISKPADPPGADHDEPSTVSGQASTTG